MICLNCGKESTAYLCEDCRTGEVLAQIYYQLMYYKPDDEQMSIHVRSFVESHDDPKAVRSCLPEIFNLFPAESTDFYRCIYAKAVGDPLFENLAITYMDGHHFTDRRTQKVLYSLLSFYIPDELRKPQKWCDQIRNTDGLALDMYYKAADYYSKVGDYDIAEQLIQRATKLLNDSLCDSFIYMHRESAPDSLAKLLKSIQGYRTKKPYWPNTEARRRIIAEIYDSKGISHPRIDKPAAVKESEFGALHETMEQKLEDYSAFWCADVFSISGVKAVYQIAAVKVRRGAVIDTFQSFLRPWDGSKEREAAAKQAGVDVSVISEAEDVDLVMQKFFAFVGQDVLISTDAFGNQAKCISRLARYSGMTEIQNPFLDLLDYAADLSSEFDMKNNTRDYLLKHFGLEQGKDALSNARQNVVIYERLKELDE